MRKKSLLIKILKEVKEGKYVFLRDVRWKRQKDGESSSSPCVFLHTSLDGSFLSSSLYHYFLRKPFNMYQQTTLRHRAEEKNSFL